MGSAITVSNHSPQVLTLGWAFSYIDADICAVTSHSSQGQTAGRVLIHGDTELGAKNPLDNRMACVAVSRGAYDAQVFTNDREKLGAALGHDVSHSGAHAPEMKPEQKQEQAVTPQREIASQRKQGEDFG
jgi:hypothetical protein